MMSKSIFKVLKMSQMLEKYKNGDNNCLVHFDKLEGVKNLSN